MSEIFVISEIMTIFAIVSFIFTILAMDTTNDDINKSLKFLKKYDPVVLIDKLKLRDKVVWPHFFTYTEGLVKLNIHKYLNREYVETDKDLVQDYLEHLIGKRMRIDDIKRKDFFLEWINWEVGYFILDYRKKKIKEQVLEDITEIKPFEEIDYYDDENDKEIKYTSELLNFLLDQINPFYAEIIRMSVYEGLKARQIAERLGYSSRFISDKKCKGMAALTRKATEYKKGINKRIYKI